MSIKDNFFKGIWSNNPVLVLLLGFCPTLAVSSSVIDALGMGVSATFVLIGSNMVISMMRNFVPSKMRIPVYIVVIATFVTIVDLVLYGYMPALHKSLGVFIPLIVVNCIVLGRAEAFANKNNVFNSFIDGLGMGVGFTLAIFVLASVREVLGNGTFMNVQLFGSGYQPVIVAVLAPGAFLTLGMMLGGMNRVNQVMDERRKAKQKALKEMEKQQKAVNNG